MIPPSYDPPDTIAPSEDVTCFIYDRRKISFEEKRAKYNAFLPDNDGERSVFRTIFLTNEYIRFIGDFIGGKRSKTLFARATIKVQKIINSHLIIEPQDDPEIPKRLGKWHAVIIGWPSEKEDRRAIAIDLANSALPDFY